MTMTSISGRVILRFPNRTKEKWLRFTPHQRFHLPTTQTPPHTASAGHGQDDLDDDENDSDDENSRLRMLHTTHSEIINMVRAEQDNSSRSVLENIVLF